MSRFGGAASRAAMSVAETMHANVISIQKAVWPDLTTARVMVTGSGKIIDGVVWGAGLPADAKLEQYKDLSVVITKAGGRWVILNK